VFFVALNADTFLIYGMLFSEDLYGSFHVLLFPLVFVFVKFLIAKYYYKTLNNYDKTTII